MSTYEEIKTQIALELLEDVVLATMQSDFCPDDYVRERDIASSMGIGLDSRSGELVRLILDRLQQKGKVRFNSADGRRREGWQLRHGQQTR